MRVIVEFTLKCSVIGVGLLGVACGSADGGSETGPRDSDLPRFGIVALGSKFPNPGEPQKASAEAFFWEAADEGSTGCEVIAALGECQVSECLPASAVAPAPGFAWLSAGPIDIIGTKLDFGFEERDGGRYSATLPSLDLSLWEGGEELTVLVQGSEQYPASSASLTAPHAVTLSAPSSTDLAIDPRADLAFEWSAPDTDIIYVDVRETYAPLFVPAVERSARCAFPAQPGAGSIPEAVFAALSPPDVLAGYRVLVSTNAETVLENDQATLTFSLWSRSFRADATIVR
jgi:hypothetical protein